MGQPAEGEAVEGRWGSDDAGGAGVGDIEQEEEEEMEDPGPYAVVLWKPPGDPRNDGPDGAGDGVVA